jgi:hypothetical protein
LKTTTWNADDKTLAIVVRNGNTTASAGFTLDLTALASPHAAPPRISCV